MTTSRPWWKRFRGGRKDLGATRPAARRSRPILESLERRLALTVSFTPFFGVEHTYNVSVGLPTSLQDPPIYPIFWGPYWQNNSIAVQVIDVELSEVINGRYLSGIYQYISNGDTANLFAPYVDSSAPPATVSPNAINGDAISGEVSKLYSYVNSPIPNPFETYATPIYVVITDPYVTSPGNNAFNEPFYDYNDVSIQHPLPANYEAIWVSTQSVGVTPQTPTGLNVDFTIQAFSHELVEAMTDPFGPVGGTEVNPGPGYPQSAPYPTGGSPGHQIADNEPNNNYAYRIGGPFGALVQAFWSDDAFDKD
jgi:hypothetical protein